MVKRNLVQSCVLYEVIPKKTVRCMWTSCNSQTQKQETTLRLLGFVWEIGTWSKFTSALYKVTPRKPVTCMWTSCNSQTQKQETTLRLLGFVWEIGTWSKFTSALYKVTPRKPVTCMWTSWNSQVVWNCEGLYGKEKFGPKLCFIWSNSQKTSHMHVNFLEFSNSEVGDNSETVRVCMGNRNLCYQL